MARKPIINPTQVWARVAVLTIGLIGVYYAMSDIKKSDTFAAFFSPPSAKTPITRSTLNLCPTRTSEIEIHNKSNKQVLRFYQKGSSWIASAEQTFELDSLFMEKWLAEFCEVKIDHFVENTPTHEALQVIHFNYIDGTSQIIQVYSQGFLTNMGMVESEELKQALLRLNR